MKKVGKFVKSESREVKLLISNTKYPISNNEVLFQVRYFTPAIDLRSFKNFVNLLIFDLLVETSQFLTNFRSFKNFGS